MITDQSATVALDSKAVDDAITLLAEAAKELPPTPREHKLYRVFAVSVDVAVFSAFVGYAIVMFALPFTEGTPFEVPTLGMATAGFAALFLGSFTAMGAVLLNRRFLRRVIARRLQMRQMGLEALSRRLHRAHARGKVIRRARDVLLGLFGWSFVIAGLVSVVGIVALHFFADPGLALRKLGGTLGRLGFLVYVVTIIVIGLFLLLSRVLRNTREEVEIAGSAEDLRRALAELRATAGTEQKVKVPAALIERAAQIESVLIDKERSRAILDSARPSRAGLAISFDTAAGAQRARLPADARLELEDLVARVSAAGIEGLAAAPQEATIVQASAGGRLQAAFAAGSAPGTARVVSLQLTQPAEAASSGEPGARHG